MMSTDRLRAGIGAGNDDPAKTHRARPVLFAFDGSANAEHAIAQAAELLEPGSAVVISVWEPAPVWEPYDPATILSAPVSKLASKLLDFDHVIKDMAHAKADRGVALATKAGFAAEGRVASGKPWRVICDLAEEIDAAAVVVGARGLSRTGSLLLGSVSFAVAVHAKCPVLIVPLEVRNKRVVTDPVTVE